MQNQLRVVLESLIGERNGVGIFSSMIEEDYSLLVSSLLLGRKNSRNRDSINSVPHFQMT